MKCSKPNKINYLLFKKQNVDKKHNRTGGACPIARLFDENESWY